MGYFILPSFNGFTKLNNVFLKVLSKIFKDIIFLREFNIFDGPITAMKSFEMLLKAIVLDLIMFFMI